MIRKISIIGVIIGILYLCRMQGQAEQPIVEENAQRVESIVAEKELTNWGYRTVESHKYPENFCDPKIGEKAKVIYQGIKSLTEVPDLQKTYYRFTLIQEIYRNESDAINHIAEIKDPPPATSKHEKFCYMRKGFRKHKTIFIPTTTLNI